MSSKSESEPELGKRSDKRKTPRRRVKIASDSDEGDVDGKNSGAEETNTPSCSGITNPQTLGSRSSSRIQAKRSRRFQMPSRRKVFDEIESLDKNTCLSIHESRSRKLVNDFMKVTNRYNYDPNYTSGEDDFIDDTFDYVDEDSCVSEDSNISSDPDIAKIKSTPKKQAKGRGRRKGKRKQENRTRKYSRKNDADTPPSSHLTRARTRQMSENTNPAEPSTSRVTRARTRQMSENSNEDASSISRQTRARSRQLSEGCDNNGIRKGKRTIVYDSATESEQNDDGNSGRSVTNCDESEGSESKSDMGELSKSILEKVEERSRAIANKREKHKRSFDQLRRQRKRRLSAQKNQEGIETRLEVYEIVSSESDTESDSSGAWTDSWKPSDDICYEALKLYENSKSLSHFAPIRSATTVNAPSVSSSLFRKKTDDTEPTAVFESEQNSVKVEIKTEPETSTSILTTRKTVRVRAPQVEDDPKTSTGNGGDLHALKNVKIELNDLLKSGVSNGVRICVRNQHLSSTQSSKAAIKTENYNRNNSSSDESMITPAKRTPKSTYRITDDTESDIDTTGGKQQSTSISYNKGHESSDSDVTPCKSRHRNTSRLVSDDDSNSGTEAYSFTASTTPVPSTSKFDGTTDFVENGISSRKDESSSESDEALITPCKKRSKFSQVICSDTSDSEVPVE